MITTSQWEGIGWFIATLGLGLMIVAETPEWSVFGEFDSIYLGIAVFNTGIMGRSLAAALNNKPDIMSARYVCYTWCLPFVSSFVVGIEFVRMGYFNYLTAMLLIIGLGASYAHLIGEIEVRDEYLDDEPNESRVGWDAEEAPGSEEEL